MSLRETIESLAAAGRATFTPAERRSFDEFRGLLACGEIRAARRDTGGTWRAESWVKQGILLGFRMGVLVDLSVDETLRFFDKDTFPVRRTTLAERVRIVPGGSTVRDGAYVAPGVVCMPPMYVNVGAYVDEGTLIDSHALVGSCAQIGKRVHLSAAAQIGGVLEPVGAVPVIIEDDVLVGGGCGVYEGTLVRERAVLAAGTILTGSTPLYDLVHQRVLRRPAGGVLEVPAGAVVVPGARAASGSFAQAERLSLYAPVIVKYRDARTDAATALEEALR
jgi:2,3,4,5-tetrahydropyridine-2-carboxylate N-succinyltransferase